MGQCEYIAKRLVLAQFLREKFATIADVLAVKGALRESSLWRPGAGYGPVKDATEGSWAPVGVIVDFWGSMSPGRGLFGYPEVVLLPWSLLPGLYCHVLSSRILGMLEMSSL